jgi:hypothetical protein
MSKARAITGLNPQASPGENARVIARERLADMYAWDEFVDQPYHIRELHDLRIAAKRLRYTLEVFEDALPATVQPAHEELVRIQEELGALHDSDVMIALLRLCLGSRDTAMTPGHEAGGEKEQNDKKKSLVSSELVTAVLNPATVPSVEERYGLERFLQRQEQQREQEYRAFRQHWYQLKAEDFRRELLTILDEDGGGTR